ncbi:phenazine biosynthesis-like domain-containing protein 1 [Pollicipes pollicipes]|uniref:phenazine biosynthesis-like domain-containing protein 1 n=1 Tax=Pollicipes pollicipes TaxID=41117 RepID=UPI001884F340|nr:phenazine biosynthesis-like domain-containing protein 1 [Pollicipes pollicipes]
MEGRLQEVFTVNAFTASPFAGNPASVCLLELELSEEQLQGVAAQMNHSETAFVTRLDTGAAFQTADTFQLRWFTPTTEVQLCGHATLVAAAVLFKAVENQQPKLTFITRWGLHLTARRDGDRIELELQLSAATGKLLLRLADSCTVQQLEALKPDVGQLTRLHDGGEVRGVIVTVRGGGQFHCQSRYFAPWVGIPEDPVTGSAHTVLGPYWARQLGVERLSARQCSPRGGQLAVAVDWAAGRTRVAGEAVIVLRGQLRVA